MYWTQLERHWSYAGERLKCRWTVVSHAATVNDTAPRIIDSGRPPTPRLLSGKRRPSGRLPDIDVAVLDEPQRKLPRSPLRSASQRLAASRPPSPSQIEKELAEENLEATELSEEEIQSRAEELSEIEANGIDSKDLIDDDEDELSPDAKLTPEETNGIELPLDRVIRDEGPSV